MTEHERQDIAHALAGYEQWRRTRYDRLENGSDDQLSVSAYLDALAHQRNADAIDAMRDLSGDENVSDPEFRKAARSILGLE